MQRKLKMVKCIVANLYTKRIIKIFFKMKSRRVRRNKVTLRIQAPEKIPLD